MKEGEKVTMTHFEKSFKLGKKIIDANKVSANPWKISEPLEDGILTVTALKDEERAPVKVTITPSHKVQNPH